MVVGYQVLPVFPIKLAKPGTSNITFINELLTESFLHVLVPKHLQANSFPFPPWPSSTSQMKNSETFFFSVFHAYPEVRVRIPYPSTYPYLSTGKENVRGTGEC